VNPALRAEAQYPAQHRGPGHAASARLFDNQFVQRTAAALVVFSDKDSQQFSF
jgi:hypothetical protein